MKYAIVPIIVYHNKNLKPNDKLLFGLINSLTINKKYCFASNNFFAIEMGVSKRTITGSLANLKKYGLITFEYENNRRKISNLAWKDISRDIENSI